MVLCVTLSQVNALDNAMGQVCTLCDLCASMGQSGHDDTKCSLGHVIALDDVLCCL